MAKWCRKPTAQTSNRAVKRVAFFVIVPILNKNPDAANAESELSSGLFGIALGVTLGGCPVCGTKVAAQLFPDFP